MSSAHRVGTLIAILLPFAGLVLAVYGAWGWAFSWVELTIFAVMYVATGMGITIGYHRLFTHRSFETIRPIKLLLAVLGSMAIQGPLLRWVATHRRHHQHSDQVDDPHSPHKYGKGLLRAVAGWWHAHIGWMFKPETPELEFYVQDLKRDGLLQRVSRLFGVWVALGLLMPALAGGLITGTWQGAFLGFLWGGLVRAFLGHHVTWSINSVCHLWGSRPYQTSDHSRNNIVFGVLAFGEGWHNNHHAFPTSAKHGLRWWQLDMSYLAIRVLEWMRLARRVRVPVREKITGLRNRIDANMRTDAEMPSMS